MARATASYRGERRAALREMRKLKLTRADWRSLGNVQLDRSHMQVNATLVSSLSKPRAPAKN